MFRILIAVVLVILTNHPADASRITGIVAEVRDTGVIITLTDESTPRRGDKVKLCYETSTGMTMKVGMWRVVSVKGGEVQAEFLSGANRPRKGLKAIFMASDSDSAPEPGPEFRSAVSDGEPPESPKAKSGIKEALIFNEDFHDNSNGWTLGQFDSHEAVVQEGKLYMRHLESGTSFVTNDVGIGWQDTFAIETRIKKRSGSNTPRYGLLFGYNEASSHAYCFAINGEGYAGLYFLNQGKWEKPIIGGKVGRLQTGNRDNTLALVRNAGITYFFINGKSLGSKDNLNLFGNRAGFSVAQDTALEVDYLRVWNDIPRHLSGALLSARAVDQGSVRFTGMKIIPYRLPAGKTLDFTATYTVTDPARKGQKLPAKLSYVVSKGHLPGNKLPDPDNIILEKVVSHKVTEGQPFTFTQRGVEPAAPPGPYTLSIGIKYQKSHRIMRQEFTILQ